MSDSSPGPAHPLALLIDETARLHGRLRTVFAGVRRAVELGESEITVLAAVVAAARAPTVSQIARSLGVPRQQAQRAANALVEQGLITFEANPDHKRAALLRATEAGAALKQRADSLADGFAGALCAGLDLEAVPRLTGELRDLRKALEMRLRTGG